MHRAIVRVMLLLAVALPASTAASCAAFGAASTPTPTPPADIYAVSEVWEELSNSAASQEDNPILETWSILSGNFIRKDSLDAQAIGQAAIDAMRSEAGDDAQAQPSPDMLRWTAIEAMLDSLEDPYTSFLDPNQYALYIEDSQGTFGGIGAHVEMIGSDITITKPIPDTPAERAGIQPGDVILEVDGESAAGWSLFESVVRIRGPENTPVSLLIRRKGVPEPVLIEVVRAVIRIDSITWEMLPGRIAYVEISTFADNTDEMLADVLLEAEELNARGMVLDLRGNLGGLLSTTVNIASQFLTDGLVLYSVDGDGQRTDYNVKPGGLARDIPLVTLVDEFSASGSEVLSGALRDHGRAILIGDTTFGKGSVNQPHRLSDGSGLYFTVGHWHSPNGHLIEGHGLEPDIRVEPGLEEGDDPQLERALEHLAAQTAAASR